MNKARFSPLAISMIWMAAGAVCLGVARLGLVAEVPYLPIGPFLASFGCFGAAVGSWFQRFGMGVLMGASLGAMVLAFAQDMRE